MKDVIEMKPGFYTVTRTVTLSHPENSLKARLKAGTWLITDGLNVGWFDKEEQFDWVPLQWKRNEPVLLEGDVEKQLRSAVTSTSVIKLEDEFHDLMFVEPGEPIPDLPKPSVGNLVNYLKARRYLTASEETYDRR